MHRDKEIHHKSNIKFTCLLHSHCLAKCIKRVTFTPELLAMMNNIYVHGTPHLLIKMFDSNLEFLSWMQTQCPN